MIHSATVNFGAWHAIADAGRTALETPGLIEARAEAVLIYPRGKSAMVFYGATEQNETLQSYVTQRGAPELERATTAGARWVRFGASQNPQGHLEKRIAHFVMRFGAPPIANQTATNEKDEKPHG